MRITEITVSAGRVIPHPRESYANLRPMLSLKATLDDNDFPADVAKTLQAAAESLLIGHIKELETQIEAEYQARCKQEDEEYEQRQRARELASVANPDALDDDEVDDWEEEPCPAPPSS